MDMFQRRTTFGGGFNMLSAKVLFAGFQSGLAFETVGLSYQQQLVRLWDLDGENGNTYLVAGHPAGNATVTKAIGPRSLSNAFYARYGDVCRAAENNLMIAATTGCVSKVGAAATFSGQLNLSLTGVVIGGTAVQISANDPVMRQNLNMIFIALDWDEQTAAPQAAA